MVELHLLTATQVLELIGNNSITVEEYARSLLDHIAKRDSIVKAWEFLGTPFFLLLLISNGGNSGFLLIIY